MLSTDRSVTVWVTVAAALWLSACGGNVVVDGAQGGGGLGGGGSAQGGDGGALPSSGPGPGPTTGPGGGQQSVCEKLCDQLDGLGCSEGTACGQSCLDVFDATPLMCKDELVAYFECYAAGLPSAGCNPGGDFCVNQGAAYANCVNNSGTGGAGGGGGGGGGCGEVECSAGSDGSCGCKGFCDGVVQGVECSAQPSGYLCDCYVDGTQIAKCSDVSNACDLDFGCCAPFFGGDL